MIVKNQWKDKQVTRKSNKIKKNNTVFGDHDRYQDCIWSFPLASMVLDVSVYFSFGYIFCFKIIKKTA